MSSLPIADYGLLSDCHSAALVSRTGSVDWLCFPRFDAPSIFGRLLDDEAGHWSIHPTGEFSATRRYFEQTLILETTFTTSSGKAALLDAMAVGKNERGHQLGADAPHALLRSVQCTEGEMAFESEFAPRPEYGRVYPLLSEIEGGVRARGGASYLLLSSAVPVALDESTCRARFHLKAGESASFALQYRASWEPPREHWDQNAIMNRIEDTMKAWQSWSSLHQNYQGPWQELVLQSGRILQGLTYYPTGAIVAAATTSLPETPGGSRNWDYRFCWVRDGSLTLEALWVAACPDEADKFFDFMTGAALTQVRRGIDLQIMFGIAGEHDLSERELSHLSGWRKSRPVRIGNGAWNQRQIDVYGELLGTVYVLRDRLKSIDSTTQEFLADVADAAAARWKEKDQGIWEMRGEPRDFLYSKLMCWVALDRAIKIAEQIGAQERVSRWTAVRDEIKNAVLEQGWSERAQAFTQSFGSDDLDASNLMIPLVGFLPADDPRVLSTIDAIADNLRDEHGLIYRYRAHDGLAGDEGTFLLCTFWLSQALAKAGQIERAKDTFSAAVSFANDLGMLAEEVDPRTRELLGNFPQAFSHIGLVNAAWAISEAERQLTERGQARAP
jgi:GH15 family glucan-1,4-alpha-glucosidase